MTNDTLASIIAEMREAGAEWCHRWPQVIDWANRLESLPPVLVDDAMLKQVDDARRYTKMMYGFMLDCNAIGAKEAGVNLAHSIKDKLAALNQGKDDV